LLLGLIVCLALEEKLHAKKSLIAGVFAILSLLLGSFTGVLSFEKILVGSTEVEPIEREIQVHFVHPQDRDDSPVTIRSQQSTQEPARHDSSKETREHHLFLDGERISMPVYIPGIDWGVIAIILGSSLFVDVASKSGIFSWIAIKVTKASLGDPVKLLYFYGVMTVVFSAVLNNVTAMIIVGSLTVVSLEKLNKRDLLLGFLLVEGLLTNIGGLLTLISSVPNIIVGSTAGIGFLDFFVKAAPYVAVATLITLIMGVKLFKIHGLRSDEEKAQAKKLVDSFDENDSVDSPSFFWFSSIILMLFILTIAFTSVIPVIKDLGMGFVAMAYAAVMLIRFRSEVNRFYSAIDWDLLGFFMALFATIYVLEHAQVLNAIGTGLQAILRNVTDESGDWLDSITLLVGSAGFSSVTDNIPLAAMLAKILQSLDAPTSSSLWWSVIFGANLGGNITPIGSASTLVAVTIMHKHGLKMSFTGFVKAALVFAVIQIALAVLYVLFVIGPGYV
ncbi:MAG: SLC13 family permease, partial [Planctomycetota bacterium]|nr:SLC13 family permease [Planctomycetota bacterium]